jgi:hypothetical protein
MASAAPQGNPTAAAIPVAERLTVKESATICANVAVPSVAQRSANNSTISHVPVPLLAAKIYFTSVQG